MLDLAMQKNGSPVQCRDIATRQDIPEPYLNQLLTVLRRANLIVSRRGPGGGHQLARPPDAISLGQIVDALDGQIALGQWVDGDGVSTGSCAGALHEIWRDVDASARRVIEQVTLAELTTRVRDRAFSYQI